MRERARRNSLPFGGVAMLAVGALLFLPATLFADPAPIVYYSFSNPNDIGHDDSGNGHDLTIPGTWSSVAGNAGLGLRVEDYGSFVSPNWGSSPLGPYATTSGMGYPTSKGFSVECRILLGSAGSHLVGVRDYWQHVAGGGTFELEYDPTTAKADFYVAYDYTNAPLLTSSVSGEPGQWVHLRGSYDPNGYTTSLYINDVLAAQQNLPAPMRSTIAPYLYVNGSWHNTTAGTIDEVKLYGQATPEPATLSLLALGGAAVLRRRRK